MTTRTESMVEIPAEYVKPEDLHTVEDLRRALHAAIYTMARQRGHIEKYNASGIQLMAFTESILKSHIENDAKTISDRCDEYLRDRPRIRERLEDEMHFAPFGRLN